MNFQDFSWLSSKYTSDSTRDDDNNVTVNIKTSSKPALVSSFGIYTILNVHSDYVNHNYVPSF